MTIPEGNPHPVTEKPEHLSDLPRPYRWTALSFPGGDLAPHGFPATAFHTVNEGAITASFVFAGSQVFIEFIFVGTELVSADD